ncbi:RNA polymerase sigma factor [Nocardia asteroides]|uniref:RNA polymerase sigma factor n=1 Tax=Nocardia asteroides TaxID=1824 RepID=UPI001E314D7A|nr:RNA polymerase sigma factor [Nocardia asteroides]UGT61867.1 RNA polymerase sigma factor [Nocardia asteroides]
MELYRDRYPRLVRTLICLGATRQIAEDAVQETFRELWSGWDTVRKPEPWLRKATKNRFLKICGIMRREQGLDPDHLHAIPDGSAERELSTWDDEQWVAQLLGQLSPAAKETVELILADYSTAEIAALLGRTPNAVRQRLHHARSQLEQLLGPDYTIRNRPGPVRPRGEVE